MTRFPISPLLRFKVLPAAALLVVFLSIPLLRLGYLKQVLVGLDESIYAVTADVLERGGKLYVDIWDHKPPLQYWIYQWVLRIHHSMLAVHLAGLAVTLMTAWLLLLVTRRILGPVCALGAVWLFSFYTSSYWAASVNGELFLNLLILAAVWLLLPMEDHPKSSADLTHSPRFALSPFRRFITSWFSMPAVKSSAAGLLLGTAIMIKPLAVIPAACFGAVVAGRGWRQGRAKGAAKAAGVYFVAAAVIPALVMAWCWEQGIARDFLLANFQYNSSYVSHDAWPLLRDYGSVFIFNYVMEQWPLLLLAMAGLIRVGWWLKHDQARPGPKASWELLTIWLVASATATASPLKFLDHYFLLVIPALCVFGMATFAPAPTEKGSLPELDPNLPAPPARDRRRLSRWSVRLLRWATAAGMLIITVVPAWRRGVEAVAIWQSLDSSECLSAEVGRYIQAHTTPQQRVLVWRADVNIYFFAGRDPAARVFFWPHLLRLPLPPGGVEQFQQDLQAHPPELIMVGECPLYEDRPFPLMEEYLARGYVFRVSIGPIKIYHRRSGSSES